MLFMSKLSFTSLKGLTIFNSQGLFNMVDFAQIFSCLKFKQPHVSLSICSFLSTAEASNVNCVKNSALVVVNLEYFVRLDYCGAFQCNSVFQYGETNIH